MLKLMKNWKNKYKIKNKIKVANIFSQKGGH